MKKILTILLILVLTFTSLVSCDKIPGLDSILDKVPGLDSILDKIPGFGGDDTENGPTLDDAKTYLFNTYKDSATAIPNDYDLVGKVIIEGVSFPVTWTASLDSITIKESTKANFWTVDLPDVNAEEVAYVLTATITDADNNKVEVKFNKTLPVIDSTGIVTEPEEGIAYKLFLEQVNLGYTLFAGNTTQNNQQKYIETTLDPKAAVDYFVEKVDGGYKIYTMINNVKNYVYAQGIENSTGISKYIGFSTENASVFTYVQEISTWQVVINNIKYGVGTYNAFETVCISEVTYFKPDNINVSGGQFPVGFMLSSYAETLTPDEKPVASDPTPDTTLTIAEAIALGNTKVKDQYTEGKYYVTGVIKEVYNDQYGNMYITDGTNTLCIYGTYDATGATSYKDMAVKPVAGDTITVYGIIGKYNDPQMKSGWITSHTPGEGGSDTPVDPKPETPTLGVVDAPVAGTAYKLGLFHGGNGNIDVFFNGQNYNNYAWYLAYGDAASAVDVYLEAVEGVEGAYRLYFMNGDAKTYIRMYPRDGDTTKGTMEMTTEVPTECYTYNTEYKTLIYTSVTGEQFYMGSSGTYKSISTSSISYITEATSYVAHFYAPVEGGDTPVDPQPPVHEHTFVDGKCECGEEDPNYVPPVDPENNEIVFDFGANGTAGTHTDGQDIGTEKTYTSGNYELVITNALKAYDGGFDKKGNSILKFGTSSVAGTITFVVPDDVTSVVIYAARYKSYADNNIIVVNGTSYELAKNSNDGEYEAITVDTTTNKTVVVASSTDAAKPRCVVDKIVFVLGEGSGDTPVDPQPPVHEHNFVDGKCECGEEDPNYVPPVQPEINYGTQDAPVSTTEAVGACKDFASGDVSADLFYVVGLVKSIESTGNYYKNVYITDGTTDLLIYTINMGDGVTGFEVGDTIVAKGYIKNYNGTIEMATNAGVYVYAISVTPATPVDPQPPVHEHNFVDGKCECGEEDPNYVPPVVEPDVPTVEAAGSADFDSLLPGSNGSSSYTASYTTDAGWVIDNSAIQAGGASVMNPQFPVIGSDNTSKAVCLNGKTSAPGKITSSTLTGGVSKVTLTYTKMFTDTALSVTIKVTDLTSGEVYTAVVERTVEKNDKYVVWTYDFVLDTAITGDFTIEVVNNCPSGQDGNKDRFTVLDLSWYA